MVASFNILRPSFDSESNFVEYWIINEDKLKIYNEMQDNKIQVNDKLLEIQIIMVCAVVTAVVRVEVVTFARITAIIQFLKLDLSKINLSIF